MNINAVYEAGAVRRFHTVADYSGGGLQSVAEHSWGVALIFAELYRTGVGTEPPAAALLYCLSHDVGESVTGDVPATTKWRFGKLADAVEAAEQTALEELGVKFFISNYDLIMLKWADALECYAYAQRRSLSGSPEYRKVAQRLLIAFEGFPALPAALKMLAELTLPEFHELAIFRGEQICQALT
jgi:5'-deoxynucleotidase YfbR-like